MSLTPKQFNMLALKTDFLEVRDKLDMIDGRISKIIDSLDGLVSRTYNVECNFAANQSAHDRFEGRLNRIEDNLELAPLFDY